MTLPKQKEWTLWIELNLLVICIFPLELDIIIFTLFIKLFFYFFRKLGILFNFCWLFGLMFSIWQIKSKLSWHKQIGFYLQTMLSDGDSIFSLELRKKTLVYFILVISLVNFLLTGSVKLYCLLMCFGF